MPLFFFNNKQAILLNLIKRQDANAIELSKEINTLIKGINEESSNIKLEYIYDDSVFVKNSILGVSKSLIWGSLFAFLVLFLFLKDIRFPIQIAITIPISILLTFLIMFIQEISINMISMGGLALGIGMLVDNSIVVQENITRHIENGSKRILACLNGVREVAVPVTASTLTSIAVFMPLLLVPGIGGAIFKDQSLTIIYSLLMSLFVSLILLPVLYYNMSSNPQNTFSLLNKFDLTLKKFYSLYEKLLIYSLDNYKRVLLIGFLVTILSFLVLIFNAKEWTPEISRDSLVINLDYKENLTAKSVEKITKTFVNQIKGYTKKTVVMNGKISQEFADQSQLKESRSIIYLYFDKPDKSKILAQVKNTLKKYPQFESEITNIKNPMEMIFANINQENLFEISSTKRSSMTDFLTKISGFQDIEFINNTELRTKVIIPDQEKLIQYGIKRNAVESILKTGLTGLYIGEFNDNDKRIPIYLRNQTANIDLVLKQSVLDSEIPLKKLVEVKNLFQSESLEKTDQHYTKRFRVHTDESLRRISTLINRNTDIHFKKSFEEEDVEETFESLIWIIILAISLVFMIMASQFESLKEPFVILFTIPMAAVGIAISLIVSGSSINLMSFMGMIVLAGIVVNDAIVKIDFIKHARNQGLSIRNAIIEAGKQRFRPILMTTLTTCLALLPMMIIHDDGFEMRFPMAITIFGGLLFATILTLIYIPLLYQLFSREN
jgi:hydrophobic/amphiphilic exporter-1 (mainly G- bacteria), HAE1 family